MVPTTELAKPQSEAVETDGKSSAAINQEAHLPRFEDGEIGVLLKWKSGRTHEIHVVGQFKASQLRHLLEFGLRHIRACLHRGRPLNSPAQVANFKQGEI